MKKAELVGGSSNFQRSQKVKNHNTYVILIMWICYDNICLIVDYHKIGGALWNILHENWNAMNAEIGEGYNAHIMDKFVVQQFSFYSAYPRTFFRLRSSSDRGRDSSGSGN